MGKDEAEEQSRAIEREARRGRKFSLADVIGREGASFFAGASPMPRLTEATIAIGMFIDRHVRDSSGSLRLVLKRRVQSSDTIVGANFDDPLNALEIIVERVLGNDARLYELVRQVDAEWGKLMLERPHFQRPGQAPDPDDEHTHEGIRAELESLLEKLRQ